MGSSCVTWTSRKAQTSNGRIPALFLVGGVAAVLLLGACGSSSGTQSVSAQQSGYEVLDGLSGPYLAFAVAGTDEGVAVVQGASGGELGAELTWIADEGAEPVRSLVPSDQPLYDISMWWTGDEVAVIGLRCPNWRSASDPPEFSEDRAANAETACGSTDYEAFAWSPTTKRWRTPEVSGWQADNGLRVVGSAGQNVLLVHQSGGSPALEVLDVGDGSRKEAPAPPQEGSSAESQFTPCLGPSGDVYGVLAWTGQAPPAVARNGWTPEVTQAGEGASGSSVLGLRSAGPAWEPITIGGDILGGTYTDVLCSAVGIVVGSSSGSATITPNAEILQSTLLPPPPTSTLTTLVRGQGTGEVLAVEQTDPDGPTGPDAVRPVEVWRLDDRSWISLGTAKVVSGSRPFAVGNQAYTLSPYDNSSTPAVRIEAP